MLKRRCRHDTFGGFVRIARDWLAILWLFGPVYFRSTVLVPGYTAFDWLAYRVDGGKVTLLGDVVGADLKRDVENAVKRIKGVESVQNDIEDCRNRRPMIGSGAPFSSRSTNKFPFTSSRRFGESILSSKTGT